MCGITFLRYAQSQQIRKPRNWGEIKLKGLNRIEKLEIRYTEMIKVP
jgi:hypothetical protein